MPTFTNQAMLTYSGRTTASNIITGELVEVLSASKSAVPAVYRQGDVITFVIGLSNAGAAALTGLSLSDDLGGYAFGAQTLYPLAYVPGSVRLFVDGTPAAAPTVAAGPPLAVSGLNVPAGGSAVLIYQAEVNSYAPPTAGAAVTSTAGITGPGISEEVAVSATIAAADAPVLTISKALSPLQVAENGQLTYTFVIQNTGSAAADAETAAVVTDTFDPALDPLSADYDGTAWVAGTDYTYNAGTGAFASIAGAVTVPAASFTQDPDTGLWSTAPGTGTLTVTGTV